MEHAAVTADLKSCLDRAIASAVGWLERNQERQGFWVGKLESNSSIEAEWILALHFLGAKDDRKVEGLVRGILKKQRADGSWEIFYEAPAGDISTTVECYAALRCAGLDPGREEMARAREWIFAHGGFRHLRAFSKCWLALIGEWPWEGTPQLPPELILLPKWFPLNIYHFSSWARATMVPLATLSAARPVRPLPPGRRLDELFPNGRGRFDYRLPRPAHALSWEGLFHAADRFLSWYTGSFPWRPLRGMCVRLCLEWVVAHQDADGGWGGIQPPWVNSLMALNAAGYPLDHPVLAKGIAGCSPPWSYERDGATFIQASNSPVWDTMLTLFALLDCGVSYGDGEYVRKAARWLLNEEIRSPGDWQVLGGKAEPAGWAFEYENKAYPDIDDTAVVLMVLAEMQPQIGDRLPVADVIRRGVNWILAMRSSNGGWAAFDKDNHTLLTTKIPFCDFGEALDPPSVDVTAHVVEALGRLGRDKSDPVVAAALRYIRSEQEADGSWFGRWGVNHIYGTAAVLPALRAVGVDMSEPFVRQAADWVASRQNEDGGWGETCSSYMDDSLRGAGPRTASQTAWALMALLAVGPPAYRQTIERGLHFLLATQTPQGTWDEPYYTGTGFPGYGLGRRAKVRSRIQSLPQGNELSRGFMINYNLYRHYFPLSALGRARRWLGSLNHLVI